MQIHTKFIKYADVMLLSIEAPENDYLYVSKSQLPMAGKGLYTAIPLYKHEIICLFHGELLLSEAARHAAINNLDNYFINMPNGTVMDCRNVSSFAKYANDASGLNKLHFKTNSRIVISEKGNVCIAANRYIHSREEVFCSYGKQYWKKYL